MHLDAVRALTLDLDDTLWPIWPAIQRAEAALHDWLSTHAPAVARRYDIVALRALRDEVARDHPEWALDFSRIRRHSIARALASCGFDGGLAEPAFDIFFAERNRLELFDEAEAALSALAARFPLFAITNGNADLELAGVARYFVGGLSAREFGVGKPDRAIFVEACRRLGMPPHAVLHVGDDWALDIDGARAAGLQVAWLRRDPDAPPPPGGIADTWVIGHLGELVDRLLGRSALR